MTALLFPSLVQKKGAQVEPTSIHIIFRKSERKRAFSWIVFSYFDRYLMPNLEDASICPVKIYEAYIKAVQARSIQITPDKLFWVQCYEDKYFTNQNLGTKS